MCQDSKGKIETIISRSPRETRQWGCAFGKKARPGQVIALQGDLGAGKTVFAKGFAEGMGVTQVVSSPTFTIMRLYEGNELTLAHFDAYRLEDEEELIAIGGEEYLGAEGVCLVEWPGRIRGLLPPDTIWISIEKDPIQGEDIRLITVEGEELHEDPCH